MPEDNCFGCIQLLDKMDAAGGGIYQCAKVPGLCLGEYGHWMPEDNIPRPLGDCREVSREPDQY